MALPARRTEDETIPAAHEEAARPTTDRAPAQMPPDQRHSTVGDLLQFAGSWVGDVEECLAAVYMTRSRITFETLKDDTPLKTKDDQELTSMDQGDVPEDSTPDIQARGQSWYGPDSTGESLLKHIESLPAWAGDDFEERLEDVIRSRGEARF